MLHVRKAGPCLKQAEQDQKAIAIPTVSVRPEHAGFQINK